MTMSTTLKRKIKIKHNTEENSSIMIDDKDRDKVKGNVECLVMRMEQMLEPSYQSPGKRRKVEARQETDKSRPRSRAGPSTRSRQTWPARASIPSLTSKPKSAANLSGSNPYHLPLQQAVQSKPGSRASPSTGSRQTWPTRAGLPGLASKSEQAANQIENNLPAIPPPLHHLGQDGHTVWTGATPSSSGWLTFQQKSQSSSSTYQPEGRRKTYSQEKEIFKESNLSKPRQGAWLVTPGRGPAPPSSSSCTGRHASTPSSRGGRGPGSTSCAPDVPVFSESIEKVSAVEKSDCRTTFQISYLNLGERGKTTNTDEKLLTNQCERAGNLPKVKLKGKASRLVVKTSTLIQCNTNCPNITITQPEEATENAVQAEPIQFSCD